ncbi:hypothetical protein R3P38DRAFT_2803701 [Favolaschia claudopus]|uniref:Uncharacterized protein n=1 Tax=Favolaschia claudopus TaxID=2862362 RepID=A0AAV9ZSA0_9AGAR
MPQDNTLLGRLELTPGIHRFGDPSGQKATWVARTTSLLTGAFSMIEVRSGPGAKSATVEIGTAAAAACYIQSSECNAMGMDETTFVMEEEERLMQELAHEQRMPFRTL